MNAALSATEKRQLQTLETSIEVNMAAGKACYRKAAADLHQIHALTLYRAHGSFEAYCDERWGISRRRGYQLLALTDVCTTVHSEDVNERQARVLAQHPPEAQREAWAAATEGGAKPTAARLEALLQADADTQVKAIEDEEEAALRDQPAREPRATRSPRDVVSAIVGHAVAIRRLLGHLPDVAEQAEAELEQFVRTVESTTES